MEINEKVLRVIGSANLPPETEMEVDDDKTITIKGAIVDIRTPSNQDGTINKVYMFKLITAEINEE